MKSIRQHIFEKLKVGSNAYEYSGEFMSEFEALVKNITNICKTRVNNKVDFSRFAIDLETYFKKWCEDESEVYSQLSQVNSDNYDDHSLYFHQHWDKCIFALHYNKLTYIFEYKHSKLKIEKFEDMPYGYDCKYKTGGYTSIIYEFPENMIYDFNKNIGKL